MKTVELRDYQIECLRQSVAEFQAGNKRVMLQMPTGAGKTETAFKLIERIVDQNKIVWWVTHRKELINQVASRLRDHDVEPSFIASGMPWTNTAPVQVCSIQTLCRKIGNMSTVQLPHLVIYDEAHHCTSKSYEAVFDVIDKTSARRLGLTATPRRLDRKPLSKHFDVLIKGPTIQSLIDQGHLCQPALYVPPRSAQYIESIRDDLHIKMGDYSVQELDTKLLGNKLVYGDAIEHYVKLSAGKPAIVFCNSVKHCREAAQEFTEAGVPAESIDGSRGIVQRQDILQRLRQGTISAVMSCDLVSEGFDLPVVACAILLRPTKSLTIYLQQIGRTLRPVCGKSEAVIIDHVNNSSLHGAPWINRYWSLDSYGAIEKVNLDGSRLKLCNKCGNYIPVHSKVCAECGNQLSIITKDKYAVKMIPTQLVKLTPGQIIWREKQRMLKTLDDFLAKAEEEGYGEEWAHKAFKAKQADDEVFFRGTKEQLVALGVKRKKGNPEAYADEILKKRAEFQAGKSGEQQHNVFTSGTLAELTSYAREKGKKDPEQYAKAVLRKRLKGVFDTGTLQQVIEAAKLLGVTGNPEAYANKVIAGRTEGGDKTSPTTGTSGTSAQESAAKAKAALHKAQADDDDFDKMLALPYVQKSEDPENFVRNIIKKKYKGVLDTGSPEEVMTVVNKLRLNNPEAFAAKVLANRKPASAPVATSLVEDDLF